MSTGILVASMRIAVTPSHGLHLDLPFAPRQKIELTFNHVETNTDSESFWCAI
jgi:hypothetical protein